MANKYFCPKCGKEISEADVIRGICPHCHKLFDSPPQKTREQKQGLAIPLKGSISPVWNVLIPALLFLIIGIFWILSAHDPKGYTIRAIASLSGFVAIVVGIIMAFLKANKGRLLAYLFIASSIIFIIAMLVTDSTKETNAPAYKSGCNLGIGTGETDGGNPLGIYDPNPESNYLAMILLREKSGQESLLWEKGYRFGYKVGWKIGRDRLRGVVPY